MIVANALRDFAKQSCARDPVMEPEQRASIAALHIDEAIEQEVTQRREHLTNRAPCDHSNGLSFREQRRESRTQHLGVLSEREQRVCRRNFTKPTSFATRVNNCGVFTLRELAAQLCVELVQASHES